MAVSENGSAIKQEEKEEKPVISNGRNTGPVSARRKAKSPSSRSFSGWAFNLLAKLTIWYAIITSLFFCPSKISDLTDDSPRICKPYISARSYVQPHVQPYYDQYAGPYVDKALPYVNQLNDGVIKPASALAGSNYQRFAAPHVNTAKAYAQAQWEKALLPQFLHAQKQANGLYDANLAPHVSKVAEVASPYYEAAKDNAGYVHEKHILPAYDSSLPYLQKGYESTRHFVIHTGIPYARHAWSAIVIFVDGTLWPKMKGLYGDNVKPQLVMISERIAKYQQGRTLRSVIEEVDTPQPSTTSGVVSSETADNTVSVTADPTTSTISLEQISASAKASGSEKIVATPEQVTADLRSWQEKFAKAADKGSEDLAERVDEIIHSMMRSDIDGEAQGLATALKKTVENSIYDIKSTINTVVKNLADDSNIENAEKEVLDTIRAAGQDIRNRANAVRQWNIRFEGDLVQRVSAAADSTLDVLDGIRDLGLQEIGLRWAWMDGITYKDWAKYHDLKKTFDEWRKEVRDVAMEHKVMSEAKSSAEAVVEESMEVAGDAAKELVRLRDVAKWKIAARDSSDDFDTRAMPAVAVSAVSSMAAEASSILSDVAGGATSIASDVSSVVVGSSQGTMESVLSQATEAIIDAASQATSSASSATDSIVKAADEAVSSASSIGSVMVESISSATEETGEYVSSIIDSVTAENYASSASGFVSSLVDSLTSKPSDNVVSSASASIASLAKWATHDPEDNLASSASSSAEEIAETVLSSSSSIASAASSKVWGGAMAADVQGSMPILDDSFDNNAGATFSEQLQSVVDEAGDKYADVTKAVSEAIYGKSQGTVESMTSVASEQYASAIAAASKALYGTPQGTAESMVSIATDKYSAAVAAASVAIYGTPTPLATLQAQAVSFYNEAVSRASENYVHAKSVASVQISGTPQPVHEQMFASIESAYSGAVNAAGARLKDALNAGSESYTSVSKSISSYVAPTQGPMESISSVASSRLNEALKLASAQYSSAKSAVGATPTPAHERYAQEAQRKYYEALGIAHERYSDFVVAASGAVYGTPSPALSSLSKAASEAVYGTPVPAYQSLLDAASSHYSVASVAASSNLEAILASAKSPAQSVLDDASAQYSAAIAAASASLSSASYAASTAVFGTPAPIYQSALDTASSHYAVATDAAASHMAALLAAASSAVGKTSASPAQSILGNISSQYSAAIDAASSSLSLASYAASTAVYGAPTGSVESLASVASENWEALVSKASEQVYGAPTPVFASITSQAGEYASQITDGAAAQYLAVQAFVSDLVIGREPDFTESVMNRLSSAYYTGYHVTIASSASSMASEVYDSASSVASSIASAASSYFTPPPEVSSILDSVTEQLNAAVDAASLQIYGSSKGYVEQASSAAAESYSSAASAVSEAVYGTTTGYAEAAQSSMSAAASSAQSAISIAIYGSPTGSIESATSVAADTFASVSSVVAENVEAAASSASSLYDSAASKVSEAVFGPEQSAVESLQSRILEAVASAQSRIDAMSVVDAVKSGVNEAASSVSSAVSSATSRAKDEL